MTTPEALTAAAAQFLRIPARTDIPIESLPDGIRVAKTQITPMPLDRKLLADSLDTWMTYWDANIRNSSKRQ